MWTIPTIPAAEVAKLREDARRHFAATADQSVSYGSSVGVVAEFTRDTLDELWAVERTAWNVKAARAWVRFVGDQTPAGFMQASWGLGYMTVDAATDAYEGAIPFIFYNKDVNPEGVGALLAQYIRWRFPEIESASRTDPGALAAVQASITMHVHARQHGMAERLAARGSEGMDPETAEAFAAWCAQMGIR